MDAADLPELDVRGANVILLMGPEERAEIEARLRAMTRVRFHGVFGEELAPEDQCLEFTGAKRGGYGLMSIRGVLVSAHHVAWVLANNRPIPPDGMIRHRVCDHPPCVRADHLALGTAADNARDRDEAGRTARGPRPHHSKLNAEDDATIHGLRGYGETIASLAEVFGVPPGAIQRATKRHAKRLASSQPKGTPKPPGAGETGEG